MTTHKPRKPKPLVNPIQYALNGMKRAASVENDLSVKPQMVARQAVESLRLGTATARDVSHLVAAYNFSTLLLPHGLEHASLYPWWRNALVQLLGSEPYGEAELLAISQGLELHDAQLAVATLEEVHQAVLKLRHSALLAVPL